ncbi:MAG: substrate-binding periplasmic protein [Bdellovibrio sp.]
MGQRIISYIFLFFLLVTPLVLQAGMGSNNTIKLRYFPRPPFIVSNGGKVSGTLATTALDAFAQSGIPFELLETPINRQMAVINNNEGADCGIGWLRNSEREKFARFTDPIYYSRPWIILANNKAATAPHHSLDEWMKNQKLRLVLSDRFSYGSYIDGKIKSNSPNSLSTSADAQQLIRLVVSGRADYMFSTEEEASFLINSAKANTAVRTLYFTEIPKGESRHIMCSKNVAPEIIAKLNKFLLKLDGELRK